MTLHLSHLILAGWCRHIEGRIERIEIPAVQLLLGDAQQFAKSLIMNDFPLPQEFNGFTNVIILDNTQDIVISAPGFLFCGHILMKVRNHVSLGLELTCVKRYPSCRLGPDTGGMVDIVRSEALLYQLVCSQSLCQLMDDGSHDFQVGKLLCAYICIKMLR